MNFVIQPGPVLIGDSTTGNLADSVQILTVDTTTEPDYARLKRNGGSGELRLPIASLMAARPYLAEAVARDSGTRRGFRQELSHADEEYVHYDEDNSSPTAPGKVDLGGRNTAGVATSIPLTMGVAAGLEAHLATLQS